MAQILNPALDPTPVLTWTPKVGDVVENFGLIGRVIELHAITGDPILREVGGTMKWLATFANCRPVL